MKDGARIRRLPANHRGRDFYVGDIHGCLELFDAELRRVGFDPSCDRVISVGDLVDRGPESMRCLSELLDQPWFHAVMGNHEDLLLASASYFMGDKTETGAFQCHLVNGGRWAIQEKDRKEFWDAIMMVQDLPHVIVVGEGQRRVNVVHAEFPDGITDADIDAGLPGVLPAELMWSRRIMGASIALPEWQEGLSLTMCGHTIDREVRLRLSHRCIDTGAFCLGKLTLTEAA